MPAPSRKTSAGPAKSDDKSDNIPALTPVPDADTPDTAAVASDTATEDPWASLVQAAEFEPANSANVDVPPKIAELVHNVYEKGLAATLPVSDPAHFATVKAVLMAAAKQHDPVVSVVTRQVLQENGQLTIRFTVGEKRGRK